MMNRPQRRASKPRERDVGKITNKTEDALIDAGKPSVSKKPHKYYW